MLDKRTLDTIRSQVEAGEFAHYGGMMVQDLLTHIDALTEQVRVLREENETHFHDILRACSAYDHPAWAVEDVQIIARSALAALEGEQS